MAASLPFIYSLLHPKQKSLILKCLFMGKTKGKLLIVAAAFLYQVIPRAPLPFKEKVGTAWGELRKARIDEDTACTALPGTSWGGT